MSRIGRAPITIPSGVNVQVQDGHVSVKGPKGQLERTVNSEMKINLDGNTLTVERPTDEQDHRAQHGLTRSLIANMVTGVSTGFTKGLEISGVGYRAQKQGEKSALAVGYSHPVEINPAGWHQLHTRNADTARRSWHRQGVGWRDGGTNSPGPAAGAIQGQRHPLCGRSHPAQGR